MIPNYISLPSRLRQPYRPFLLLLCSVSLFLTTACQQATTAATVAQASHDVAVVAAIPQPITFYEGPDELEPFTPFFVGAGALGTIVTIGFAQAEGAYYLTGYATNGWKQNSLSNGFSPTDPLWECDAYADTSLAIAADTSALARSCIDGSLTIFNLPDALPVYHISATQATATLGQRAPVVAFSTVKHMVAMTNDGPAGLGNTITFVDTTIWQPLSTMITVTNGLLSRPAWSADGKYIAAVDGGGTVQIWSAETGIVVAQQPLSGFVRGSVASDVASPAPQWSPSGTQIYVSSPTNTGTNVTAFTFTGTALALQAQAAIDFPVNKVNPQLAPDGSALFVHTGVKHGQIFTAPALRQVSDFALPAELAVWSTTAQQIAVFTLNASVIALDIGMFP